MAEKCIRSSYLGDGAWALEADTATGEGGDTAADDFAAIVFDICLSWHTENANISCNGYLSIHGVARSLLNVCVLNLMSVSL